MFQPHEDDPDDYVEDEPETRRRMRMRRRMTRMRAPPREVRAGHLQDLGLPLVRRSPDQVSC